MISVLHPSKGRPNKALQCYHNWMDKAEDRSDIEWIVGIDSDDLAYYEYIKLFEIDNDLATVRTSHQSTVVAATNMIAREASGQILIYVSDDFDCPKNWDRLIIDEILKYSGPTLIKVDDCLQAFQIPVLTIPIMNRPLYQRLGFFWHPDFRSMFCDVDLYYTVQKLGALKFAPHLKFPHNHVSIGKAENDETYRRSAANWNQGQEVFNRRKAAGFPV